MIIFLIFLLKKISNSLKNGQNIEIRGFGTLSRKINKEKFVRNPKTNEKLFKNQSYKLHFKIGKILHKKINNLMLQIKKMPSKKIIVALDSNNLNKTIKLVKIY